MRSPGLMRGPTHRGRSARWPAIIAATAWCVLIAGTSSKVILPQDLFGWLASHVFGEGASLRGFVVFWGYGWFFIVKGWHVAEFAILLALTLAALGRISRMSARRNLALAAVLCLLFAVSDEYHQTFVPGRGGTCRDVAIDGFGIALASAFASTRSAPGPNRSVPPEPE